MKFRMFTDAANGRKLAVNVDFVLEIEADKDGTTAIFMRRPYQGDVVIIEVAEDFDTVFSRLNTIAE